MIERRVKSQIALIFLGSRRDASSSYSPVDESLVLIHGRNASA